MRNFSHHYLRFTIPLLAALLTACSSSSERKPLPQGMFTPQERNGLKLFEYTLRIAPAQAKPIRRNVDGNAPPPRQPDSRDRLKQAHRLLDSDTRLIAYCPNGYLTLDEYVLLGELKIRGECRYEATQEES